MRNVIENCEHKTPQRRFKTQLQLCSYSTIHSVVHCIFFQADFNIANKYIPTKICDYISILLLPIQMRQFIQLVRTHYSLFAENNIMNTKHIIIIILHFIHIPICNSFYSFTNPR